MIRWTLAFLVLALIAGLLGFTQVAGESMYVAKILFFVFLVILVVGLASNLVIRKKVSGG